MLEALGSLLRNPENGPLSKTLAKQAPTWLAQFPSSVKAEQKEVASARDPREHARRMVREICE